MIDPQDCHSVCLALGPYRNLTTLTAATLFLHPDCQVLNHGGRKILGNPSVDFLLHYSPETFRRFLCHAVDLSVGGERGDPGGSILLSHAFDDVHPMKSLYSQLGGEPVKPRIRCLFWKESLRTALHIRRHGIDLPAILRAEPRLRFLMPVRNPLDCAVSNVATGHATLFPDTPDPSSPVDVLRSVLRELAWFRSQQRTHPDRFHSFFEFDVSRESLVDMARFLALEPQDAWLNAAESAMRVRRGRMHSAAFVAHYRKEVEDIFHADRPWKEKLLEFASGPGAD